MIAYQNNRCGLCGLALFYMPRDTWPPKWQECWNEACPNAHKQCETTTVDLKAKA
jgi:hypothetical protein